jgi:hypothetical protein
MNEMMSQVPARSASNPLRLGSTRASWLVAVALLLGVRALGAQQPMTVSGHVTSGNAPVVGARVRVEELQIERTTDASGRYSFLISAGSVRGQTVRLVASMSDRRVRYVPKSALITLVGQPVTQDFVLELASSASPVASTDTTARARATADLIPAAGNTFEVGDAPDIGSALAARVPNLLVSPPSTAGGAGLLTYRGGRAILSPSQPLYVVDGIPVSSTVYSSLAQRLGLGGYDYGHPVSDFDLADVATAQFLAGPEAVARYGGRGANGVVVLTTKTGEAGNRFSVFGGAQRSAESAFRLPSLQNQYGQGMNGKYEFFDGRGGGINENVAENWGPALDGRAVAQPSYTDAARPDVRVWRARPNNVADYFESAQTTTITAGVQGRSDFGSFRLFGGDRHTTGVTPNHSISRRDVGLHFTLRPSPRLALAGTGFATENKNDNAPGTGFNESNPVSQFMGMGRQVDTDSLRVHVRDARGAQISWNYAGHNNPYFATSAASNFSRRYHTMAGASAAFTMKPWLTATARGGVEDIRDGRLFSIGSGWMGGFPSYTGAGDFSKGGSEGNEVFVRQTTASVRFDATPAARGSKRLAWSVGADLQNGSERARSLGIDSILHLPSAGAPATARRPDVSTWSGESRNMAVYGELGGALAPGVDGAVALRNAWTSVVSGQSGSNLFPSVRASVDLVRAMSSLKTNALFSAVTLRGAWWRDGGDITPYTLGTMFAGRALSGNIAPVGTSQLLIDANITTPVTSTFQLGGDVTLRARRVTLGLTYYNESTSGVVLPSTQGGALVAMNTAAVSNRGLESRLTSVFGNGEQGLGWDFTATAAFNTNTVDALSGSTGSVALGPTQWGISSQARLGQPLGVLMGRRQLRDASGRPLLRNGLPLPDSVAGQVVLGDAQPKSIIGARGGIRYRWIAASATLSGRLGGSVFSGTNVVGSSAGTLASTAFRPDSGLLITGVDVATGAANTKHASTQDYYHALAAIQEPWVYSASVLKLRDARLTFTLPTGGRSVPFDGATLSVIGRNLFMWAKAPNIDPETLFSPYQTPGIELGQLPATKSVGVQISFTP